MNVVAGSLAGRPRGCVVALRFVTLVGTALVEADVVDGRPERGLRGALFEFPWM